MVGFELLRDFQTQSSSEEQQSDYNCSKSNTSWNYSGKTHSMKCVIFKKECHMSRPVKYLLMEKAPKLCHINNQILIYLFVIYLKRRIIFS